ncbi:hypothetical protein AL190_002199 [Vibrio parahaemolyticus]|nr:hypothetical protein [Vibrio vulnificus]EJE4733600.1 hypothetical protein [Vibrio parahaemolyticus]ODZ36581.1 hypothetical protein BBN02_12765 [Vibrio parahaemolyticus]TOK69726.1 hypothetical protein CGI14_08300 [Vibrio parahaemolyticus]
MNKNKEKLKSDVAFYASIYGTLITSCLFNKSARSVRDICKMKDIKPVRTFSGIKNLVKVISPIEIKHATMQKVSDNKNVASLNNECDTRSKIEFLRSFK